jgi:ankyrin repeat protein
MRNKGKNTAPNVLGMRNRSKQSQISSTSSLCSSGGSKLASGSNFSGEATVERIGHESNGSKGEQANNGSAPTGYLIPGWTILHAAVRNGISEGVKASLAVGMSPTCETEDMAWTPLWVAACTGNLDITEILLNAGANVNATTRDGRTAVQEAAKIGATDIVELLIKRGADLEISPSKHADTPLISAAAKGHTATVKALLTAGANIRAAQSGGWTALHYALLNKNSEMACMILEYSPDTNASTMGGTRALHLAALAGMTSVASLLLDMGAEEDAVDSGGLTALRVAVQAGELEMVKLLVERGAKPDVVDGWHQHTLMDVALIQGHTSVYLYLQQLLADRRKPQLNE